MGVAAAMMAFQRQAAEQIQACNAPLAEYPTDGFTGDDPRVQPVEGISIAHYAIAGRAIGWSTDSAFIERVTAALGMDVAQWERVSAVWIQRIRDDIVLRSAARAEPQAPTGESSRRSRRRWSVSDCLSARPKSTTRAMTKVSDCSTIMIAPPAF